MELIESMGAVALVLALLLAVLFALRQKGLASFAPSFGKGTTKRMQVVERVPLGPQHALHLVRFGDVECLITTSPHSCQMHPMPSRTE